MTHNKLEARIVFLLVTLAMLASLAMAALASGGEIEADYFKRVAAEGNK